jgi:DNA-binding transcriptional MerR regulator
MKSATVQQRFRVGEVAAALCVTARYLKLLEAAGAIPRPERDERGFRTYSVEDLDRLRAIGVGKRPRRLKTVEEIAG